MIVAAKRMPISAFMGQFAAISATELGASAIAADEIDEVRR